MPEQLPPLTALRAFSAAARHLSFAKAADELHVTPAALSFQIKSLEEHLGAKLFNRLNRAVTLTEAGRILAPGTDEAFALLKTAWRSAKRQSLSNTLNVTAGPAFTAKWLAPRLIDFARAHPDIELRFVAGLRIMDFRRDEIDVAIRFGEKTYSDLTSVDLNAELVFPVMTPELANRYADLDALVQAPLIVDHSIDFLSPRCDWDNWFRAAGRQFFPSSGPHFSNADHAIDAALSGAGVVLGRSTLVAQDLASGRLVAPFDIAIKPQARFRLLCRPGAEERPAIAQFRDWVLGEMADEAGLFNHLDVVPVGATP